MKELRLSPKVCIRENAKGRAVYAIKDIRRGEIVETCPVLVIYEDFWKEMRNRKPAPLADEWAFYYHGAAAIALGAGSLYNHSYTPNAYWKCGTKAQKQIVVYAHRRIAANDEITINYMGDPDCREDVGFKVLP